MATRHALTYAVQLVSPRILLDRAAFGTLLRAQRDALVRQANIRGGDLGPAPLAHRLLVGAAGDLDPRARALCDEHGITVVEPAVIDIAEPGAEPEPVAFDHPGGPQLVSVGEMVTRQLWEPHGPVVVTDPAVPPGEAYIVPPGWRRLVADEHRDPVTPEQWRRVVALLGDRAAIIRNIGDDRVDVEPVDQSGAAPDTIPADWPS